VRDRIVVIAGGANGIGRSTVERFKREGAMLGYKSHDTPNHHYGKEHDQDFGFIVERIIIMQRLDVLLLETFKQVQVHIDRVA
jgi:NAD(P)-dependent dehydrogenase (short-subunit alcohol dehydrogenase family)